MDKIIYTLVGGLFLMNVIPGIFNVVVKNSPEYQEMQKDLHTTQKELQDALQYKEAYQDGVQDAN